MQPARFAGPAASPHPSHERIDMRIRILSDLHLEFHRDGGGTLISSQADADWDVMVLAGDITDSSRIVDTMELFKKVAGSRPIILVAGNHEYYQGSWRDVHYTLDQLEGIHFLDNRTVTIEGQRFVGTTLWFRHSGMEEPNDVLMNDFRNIRGFRGWVDQEAKKSSSFLDETISTGDIVVTHYLPHARSIHPDFEHSVLNPYFLHNVSPLVEDRGAKLWIHGHTHCSMDYDAGPTRVICNPFGYIRCDENRNFQEHLTVSV